MFHTKSHSFWKILRFIFFQNFQTSKTFFAFQRITAHFLHALDFSQGSSTTKAIIFGKKIASAPIVFIRSMLKAYLTFTVYLVKGKQAFNAYKMAKELSRSFQ